MSQPVMFDELQKKIEEMYSYPLNMFFTQANGEVIMFITQANGEITLRYSTLTHLTLLEYSLFFT